MKKLIIITIAMFLGVSSNALKSSNRTPDNDTLTCLLIKGKIRNADKGPDRNCLIELLDASGVVESVLLEGKKNFQFKLQRDTYYAIRISKPGFVTRLVSVNTSFPQEVVDMLEFVFTTELMQEEITAHLNKDALDFPIAIIHFDFTSENFIYNKAYTENIKREIYRPAGSRGDKILATLD